MQNVFRVFFSSLEDVGAERAGALAEATVLQPCEDGAETEFHARGMGSQTVRSCWIMFPR